MPGRRPGSEEPFLPLTVSPLRNNAEAGASWFTSPSYEQSSLPFSATAFHSVTDALLENPNLNSSHLFRADIVFDTTGTLKTNQQKEDFCCVRPLVQETARNDAEDQARPSLVFAGFKLRRTVLRRLIPRNPQLDRSLLQTCHIYTSEQENRTDLGKTHHGQKIDEDACVNLSLGEKLKSMSLYRQSVARDSQHLVVYQPHADPLSGSDMPWYHPPLKFLAYLYSYGPRSDSNGKQKPESTLSIHFQLFQTSSVAESPSSITNRVHRTLLSLLSTVIRLARNTPVCINAIDGKEEAKPQSATQHIKDNIVPEHLVQNTYSRLKTAYAADLIKGWVEKTDPSKHVFEDLSIAAFLIELWRKMYISFASFPGFVDIACGNGVLVYILIKEGYQGFGFDARVRRTWSTFPVCVTTHLQEMVCIPRPFLEVLQSEEYPLEEDLVVHDGIFEAGTFIISNHADELTTWTPLLAALSDPESPLPWLTIPCCSHALSGAAHRYQPMSHQSQGTIAEHKNRSIPNKNVAELDCDEQPRNGDLTALRAFKDQSRDCLRQAQSNRTNSTYASLVNHVTYLAKKVDHTGDVQQTLMRIPSTRNIGVVGGQLRGLYFKITDEGKPNKCIATQKQRERANSAELTRQIYETIGEECTRSGGVAEAAKSWMESVKKVRGATRHTYQPNEAQ